MNGKEVQSHENQEGHFDRLRSYAELAGKVMPSGPRSMAIPTRGMHFGIEYAEWKIDALEAKLDAVRELCGTRIAGSAAEAVLEVLDAD